MAKRHQHGWHVAIDRAQMEIARLQPESAASWNSVLPALAASVQAELASLSVILPKDGRRHELLFGLPLELLAAYRKIVAHELVPSALNTYRRACAAMEVEPATLPLMFDIENLNGSWRRMLENANVAHIATLPIVRTEKSTVVLRFCFSADHGSVTPDEQLQLCELAQRCRQALLIRRTLRVDATSQLCRAFTDSSVAALILNDIGEVMSMSENFDRFVGLGDAIKIQDGGLSCGDRHEQQQLRASIEQALHGAYRHISKVSVHSRSAEINAAVIPLPPSGCDMGFGAKVMLILTSSPLQAQSESRLNVVADPLTQAETAVAEQLLRGRRMGEIAQLRKVSIETVRTQVKAIYSKMQVKDQIELLAEMRRTEPE